VLVTEVRNPLRRLIENHTDRLFAKGMYNPAELRKQLENISQTYAKQEDLIREWLQAITKQLKIGSTAIVITSGPQIDLIEKIDYAAITRKDWQAMADWMQRDKAMVVTDELGEEAKIFRDLGIEVTLPVILENQMLAFLALGEKKSGDVYSNQDLSVLRSFARTAAIALARSEATQTVETLYNQARTIISNQDLKEVLDLTIESAFLRTHSDGGSIMLVDDKTNTLTVAASSGLPKKYHSNTIEVGEGIAGKVALRREAVIIPNGERELEEFMKKNHMVSAMSVPLIVGDNLIGVLNVNRIKNKEPFSEADKGLVGTLAANIAQKIQNAKLIEEDREKDKEVINIFSKALETRDPYTFGHSEQVTEHSVAIAKEMGLDEEQIFRVERAAILHDIGKIGVPDNILLKKGGLTTAEYQRVKEHPVKSMELILEYSKLKDVAMIALSHHERVDGNGYPEGLKGDEIPIEAKILAVADSFGAMTSDRPYREAMPVEVALQKLIENSGTQFDPAVVDAFLQIINSSSELVCVS
jgi:putative nucleotidyltransferase with HDIG domain